MIAIRLTLVASSTAPLKTRFGPGHEPPNVLVMPGNDQSGSDCHEAQDLRRAAIVTQQPRQQRKERHCDDGAQRYIAKRDYHRDKNSHGNERGFGRQQRKSTQGGSYSLASPELEPEWEDVSDNSEQGGGCCCGRHYR